MQKKIIALSSIVGILICSTFLFQNFIKNKTDSNKRHFVKGQVNIIKSLAKANLKPTKISQKIKLCPHDSDKWVLSVNIEDAKIGQAFDIELNNIVTKDTIQLSSIKLPYTHGDCFRGATDNEIKFCFKGLKAYDFDLNIVSEYAEQKVDLHKYFLKDMGCDDLPQEVVLSLRNGIITE